MTGFWTDPTYPSVMKEQEPANRARFLSMTYKHYPESFPTHSPDEILVSEFGPDKYTELLDTLNEILPIVAIPSIALTA